MIDKIILNILNSSITDSKKEELILYAKKLDDALLPIIFEQKQLENFFNIDAPLELFMFESVKSHTIYKKKKSELREINVPNSHLKKIQSWILQNILETLEISPFTFSFAKNRSIVDHANIHQSNKDFWLLTIDIKNFFPSIVQDKVFDIFRQIGYSDEVSRYLSGLCCYKKKLSQGFPTSPIISNIYLKEFDFFIDDFCSKNNIKFSRYADDLAFSGEYVKNHLLIIEELKKLVEKYLELIGLVINTNKTKLFLKNHPKKITGIMLTKSGLSVPNKLKKFLSNEIYYCEKFGVEDHLIRTNRIKRSNYKGYMYGIVGYIKLVEPQIGEEYLKRLEKIYWG